MRVGWIGGIFVTVRVSKNVTSKVYEYKTALLPFMWTGDCVAPVTGGRTGRRREYLGIRWSKRIEKIA
jgi:hypothetical protein